MTTPLVFKGPIYKEAKIGKGVTFIDAPRSTYEFGHICIYLGLQSIFWVQVEP